MPDDASKFLDRLREATNAHDLDAIVACFTPGYRSETPAHPARSFAGTRQVRANLEQMFDSVPDLAVQVSAHAAIGSDVWSEWEMSGTRMDGGHHLLRGVIVFALSNDRAASGRIYLEPVDESGGSIPLGLSAGASS
jgi:hypothetical protein